jgi:hypothetical protein
MVQLAIAILAGCQLLVGLTLAKSGWDGLIASVLICASMTAWCFMATGAPSAARVITIVHGIILLIPTALTAAALWRGAGEEFDCVVTDSRIVFSPALGVTSLGLFWLFGLRPRVPSKTN